MLSALTFVNYKRFMKKGTNIFSLLIIPLLTVIGINYTFSGDRYVDSSSVAFNVGDKGQMGSEMLKELGVSKNIFINDEKSADKLLEQNDVAAVYCIPEDFSEKIKSGEKPTIESFKREKSGASSLEVQIDKKVNEKLETQILINKGLIKNANELNKKLININVDYKKSPLGNTLFLTVYMVIYCIILSSTNIATEMLALRNDKVLLRTLTTANRGYEIIGSFYLAIFLAQISMSIFVIAASKFILGFQLVSLHIIFANIILSSLFSLSAALIATRVFNNAAVVSNILTLYSAVSIILSTFAQASNSNVSIIVKSIAKLTPHYWAIDSITSSKLFPNSIIMLLMTVAMFTAGSIKARSFLGKVDN